MKPVDPNDQFCGVYEGLQKFYENGSFQMEAYTTKKKDHRQFNREMSE